MTAICASQSVKLDLGPMWPPHSAPSKTNRRVPEPRNCRSSPGDGTCRKVAMPACSSSLAWAGRPPATIAQAGVISRIASYCAARSSSGTKPSTPTPHGRPRSAAAAAQHPPGTLAVGQRQRDERQRTVVGDRGGESRLVADPGHRALRDRYAQVQILGQPGALRHRVRGSVVAYLGHDGRPDRSHGRRRVRPAGREGRGQAPVLPDGQQRRVRIPRPGQPQGRTGDRDAAHPRHHDGLRPVQAPQHVHHVVGQIRFRHEPELAVENDAGRAAGDARDRGAQADSAGRPDGKTDGTGGEQPLQQHERAQFTHPPAGFHSPGDQAVRPRGDGVCGLGLARHLDEDTGPGGDLTGAPWRVSRQDGQADVAAGRAAHVLRGGLAAGRDADACLAARAR